MIQLKKITGNKKIYLDLLLLADPEEKAIDNTSMIVKFFLLLKMKKF